MATFTVIKKTAGYGVKSFALQQPQKHTLLPAVRQTTTAIISCVSMLGAFTSKSK